MWGLFALHRLELQLDGYNGDQTSPPSSLIGILLELPNGAKAFTSNQENLKVADAVNLEVKKLMVEVDVIEDAKLKQANGESKVENSNKLQRIASFALEVANGKKKKLTSQVES
ncbi:Hypothetical predicted protein [Olea europaea subsp. europaea]|uniref:Uncharacterized protein n=1 Tax=Olea europaea subsp. europaea TaxID=158383 RepID=A0A8S0UDT9_OLEEU|nr:Hypothetical predicted protein [Olea europaea subsp. europaea]